MEWSINIGIHDSLLPKHFRTMYIHKKCGSNFTTLHSETEQKVILLNGFVINSQTKFNNHYCLLHGLRFVYFDLCHAIKHRYILSILPMTLASLTHSYVCA